VEVVDRGERQERVELAWEWKSGRVEMTSAQVTQDVDDAVEHLGIATSLLSISSPGIHLGRRFRIPRECERHLPRCWESSGSLLLLATVRWRAAG